MQCVHNTKTCNTKTLQNFKLLGVVVESVQSTYFRQAVMNLFFYFQKSCHLFSILMPSKMFRPTIHIHCPVTMFYKISLLRLLIFKMMPWNPSTIIEKAIVTSCFLVSHDSKMLFVADQRYQFLCYRNCVLQQVLQQNIFC